MRKFVSSIISALIMCGLSLIMAFALEVPLANFIYKFFLAKNVKVVFNEDLVGKLVGKNSTAVFVMVVQILLIVLFLVAMFFFIKSVLKVFLEKEKIIRLYYSVFFFVVLIVPIIPILISIFTMMSFVIALLIVEFVLFVLITALTVFSYRILPDTTDNEYRKNLFTEGNIDE